MIKSRPKWAVLWWRGSYYKVNAALFTNEQTYSSPCVSIRTKILHIYSTIRTRIVNIKHAAMITVRNACQQFYRTTESWWCIIIIIIIIIVVVWVCIQDWKEQTSKMQHTRSISRNMMDSIGQLFSPARLNDGFMMVMMHSAKNLRKLRVIELGACWNEDITPLVSLSHFTYDCGFTRPDLVISSPRTWLLHAKRIVRVRNPRVLKRWRMTIWCLSPRFARVSIKVLYFLLPAIGSAAIPTKMKKKTHKS